MAYIGTTPTSGDFVLLDSITTSATASYTMQRNSVNFEPQSANHMIVSLNGTIQAPVSSFTVSGSTITFASALTSSDVIDFILVLGNVNDVGTATTVVDSAITKNKLNLISESSSAGLTVKGDGSSENGTIQLNCSQNSHGVKISSPAHSAGQSYELILPTGNVTADKFLKVASVSGSGTTGIGQLSFADAGGTLVQTGRTVISGGNPATVVVDSCFSSTYDTYMIVIDKVEQTVDSQVVSCRLRDSGGSVTASNYKYANRIFDDDGSPGDKNANSPDNKFDITNDSDDSSNNAGFNGIMYVHRPNSANEYTRMNTFTSFYNNTVNDIRIGVAACSYQNAETHTGIEFNISSGGVRDGGSITVYGIAYS